MTGLVYLAIIALWVMFLIPWLGRHRDEQNGRKSADRYHRAMDTLARASHRLRSSDEDDADGQADEPMEFAEDRRETPALPGVRESWSAVSAALRPSIADRRSSAARRRRTVLLVLLGASLASVAASLAGVVPGAVPALTAGLLIAYVTLLLRQVSRSALPAGTARRSSAEADRYREATRRAQAQARGLLVPEQRDQAAAPGWDAVPTTLPTYVSKPRAAKVPRVMDLTASGSSWNGEAMVAAAQEERRRVQVSALQEQIDREMAAVEPDPVDAVAALANPADVTGGHRIPLRRAANS